MFLKRKMGAKCGRLLALVFLILIGINIIVFCAIIQTLSMEEVVPKSGLDKRESISKCLNSSSKEPATTTNENPFRDDDVVDNMMENMANYFKEYIPSWYWNSTLDTLTKQLGLKMRKYSKQLSVYQGDVNMNDTLTPWKSFISNIRQFSLYNPEDPSVSHLLLNLETLPIVQVDEIDGGTQLDICVVLSDGTKALMKPMRYARDVQSDKNRFHFDILERHFAEIAAFHLDKILGFYRVPPTTGRKVNITSELLPLASRKFKDTVFRGRNGNTCFYGNCKYWCLVSHAFCGDPDVIEVSLMTWLPHLSKTGTEFEHPWKRSYKNVHQHVKLYTLGFMFGCALCYCSFMFDCVNFRAKAYWETHADYCKSVRRTSINRKKLLDVIDMSLFDFLTGNEDRHSFIVFTEFKNNTYPIMMDNGKGFHRYVDDSLSILEPLVQCCLIRRSTLLKFMKLYQGPERLSYLMGHSLRGNPISPVLLEGHLTALDRRVTKILRAVAGCLEKLPFDLVVKDDQF